jgi:hypothetical protein
MMIDVHCFIISVLDRYNVLAGTMSYLRVLKQRPMFIHNLILPLSGLFSLVAMFDLFFFCMNTYKPYILKKLCNEGMSG